MLTYLLANLYLELQSMTRWRLHLMTLSQSMRAGWCSTTPSLHKPVTIRLYTFVDRTHNGSAVGKGEEPGSAYGSLGAIQSHHTATATTSVAVQTSIHSSYKSLGVQTDEQQVNATSDADRKTGSPLGN